MTDRVLLTTAVLAVFLFGVWLMRRSWLRRAARDGDLLPLPVPPEVPGRDEVAPLPGLFLGTVRAEGPAGGMAWTDRVAAGGLSHRATGTLHRGAAGVTVHRDGVAPVFVPADRLRGARVAAGIAGRVVGQRGVLVVRWEHRGVVLESGFRADDPVAQVAWAKALQTAALANEAGGVR